MLLHFTPHLVPFKRKLFIPSMAIVEERAEFNVDRTDAAVFLNVSTRTVDRYVRAGKLSCKKVGYHVYLSQKELESLKKELGEHVSEVSIVEDQQERDTARKSRVQSETIQTNEDIENSVYKALYERAALAYEKKQKEVELLNFRLGQMEMEMKNRIPLLEYQGQVEEFSKEHQALKDELIEKRTILEQVEDTIRGQELMKKVYMGVAVFALVITTFLFLFRIGG